MLFFLLVPPLPRTLIGGVAQTVCLSVCVREAPPLLSLAPWDCSYNQMQWMFQDGATGGAGLSVVATPALPPPTAGVALPIGRCSVSCQRGWGVSVRTAPLKGRVILSLGVLDPAPPPVLRLSCTVRLTGRVGARDPGGAEPAVLPLSLGSSNHIVDVRSAPSEQRRGERKRG